jgi:hypothetical protein
VDSGVIEPFDPRPYPSQWYLHKDTERYLEWLDDVSIEVATPRRGDIGLWRFGRCFSHTGIFISPDAVVHATAQIGRCDVSSAGDPTLATLGRRGGPRPVKYLDVFARVREIVGG